ncbi:hypothetical protein ACJIZ3_013604 [Penstemon smallii]|uniref:Uncharacterized protein n=1 Tax=Penstemon smallii TaxID=265156 RepID=A0ABD3RNX9_9LAMI
MMPAQKITLFCLWKWLRSVECCLCTPKLKRTVRMSYNSHKISTPWSSRKRKERDSFYSSTSSKPSVPQAAVSGTNRVSTSSKEAEQQPLSSNRVLAGYMAYEFLTKGTLLGQKFDPARAEAIPVNSPDSKRNKPSQSQVHVGIEAERIGMSKPHNYAEMANLLKSDGAHIPEVVNPTHLARWIQM